MASLHELSLEYSAYMTTVNRWVAERRKEEPSLKETLDVLEKQLDEVHKEFGAETVELENGGEIVGRVYRREE